MKLTKLKALLLGLSLGLLATSSVSFADEPDSGDDPVFIVPPKDIPDEDPVDEEVQDGCIEILGVTFCVLK
ncbi:hypothetical protein [Aliikangiella sp. G2MR2-5]|uniref:hypothetical protein n=1 Tax=Aliikangiella sp. G2MR2-5 TaxID=2788943 RepID=UPI0018A8E817|nr:hypothetical protein [Aliikangiella sp. G2MR2-5]